MMTVELRTIVVATDGSKDSKKAESVAVDLCRHSGAALHLVHAWHYAPVVADAYPMVATVDDYQVVEDAARAVLNTSAERIAAAGGTVAGKHLRCGIVAEEIVAAARELDADLLLIGSRGLGPLGRLVMGSVSDGVVHAADRPVLVMRDVWPPRRVIIGDDGSDDAAAAAAIAASLAAATAASLTLVQAVPDIGLATLENAARDNVLAMVRNGLHDRAEQLLGEVASKTCVVAVVNDPATLLLDTAEAEVTSALLVVGSRGRRAFERFRLGSVSTKLLHAARCPILIVPHHRS